MKETYNYGVFFLPKLLLSNWSNFFMQANCTEISSWQWLEENLWPLLQQDSCNLALRCKNGNKTVFCTQNPQYVYSVFFPQIVMYVVVQFYSWFNFYFPLFLCMVMYDNEYKTKESKN